MITIEGKSLGVSGSLFDPMFWEPADILREGERFLVRHLIEKLVHESVRDFHLREKDRLLAALTPEKLQEGLAKGRVGSPREEAQSVDPEEAVGSALQAFEDGLFLLFVDDVEKKSLEDEVRLNLDSKVTVIRLTALAGG